MVATIASTPRLVMFQFNSTNLSFFSHLLRFNPEAPKKPGQNVPNGTLIIGPAGNISVNGIVDQMGTLGYELVDAYRRQLPDSKNPGKEYSVACFLFSPHQFAKPCEGFEKNRGKAFAELRKLSRDSMWTIKGFNNPYFTDGAEMPGERALLFNCQARKPLTENGNPILVWPKGHGKDNPGSGKIPLQPDDKLLIEIGNETVQAAA